VYSNLLLAFVLSIFNDRTTFYVYLVVAEMNMKIDNKNLNIALLILICIFTVVLSSWPGFHPESYLGLKYHWAMDMFFHSSWYCVITVLLARIFQKQSNSYWFFVFLIGCSYIIELTQLWIPGRTFTVLDLTSNTIGITTGGLIHWFSKNN
jgi:glycopeptide antibiotics resistance protein